MDIKAYIPIDNPRFVHLQYENYQAVISIDFGASLQHLSIDDYKLVHGLVDEGSLRESFYGSYAGAVLAPFANRIKNGRFRFENKDCFFSCNEAGINAIHGCVADKPFDVTELSSDPEKA